MPPPTVESNARVKVLVRIRPLRRKELASGVPEVVRWPADTAADPNVTLSVLDPACLQRGIRQELLKSWSRDFIFDKCLWSNVSPEHPLYGTQEDLFQEVGEPVIEWITTGFNCCVFAFGQTGSGKTHSMMGNITGSPHAYGLTPRICFALFESLSAQARNPAAGSSNTDSFVTFSHMEIYNELCRDLLTPPQQAAVTLKLREHPQKGIFVAGLTHVRVTCFEEVMSLIEIGGKNRTVGATNVNALSSRSHAIVTLTVVQRARQAAAGAGGAGAGAGGRSASVLPTAGLQKIEGRVHLVDLAGSERVALSGARATRLKEACSINKSLSVLGDVILSLSTGKRGHIPYRNSSLTMVLKDSLGGNSHAVMVATVSPSAYDYEETLSTLKYADRAKRVRMRVDANVTSGLRATSSDSATLVPLLQAEVRKLKEMLLAQQKAAQELHEKLTTQSVGGGTANTSIDHVSSAGENDDFNVEGEEEGEGGGGDRWVQQRQQQMQQGQQGQQGRGSDASMRARVSELEQQLAEREELIVSLEMARIAGGEGEGGGGIAYTRPSAALNSTSSSSSSPAPALPALATQGRRPARAVLATEAQDTHSPRLINLNQDPLFSECLVYYLPPNEVAMAGSAEQALVPLAGPDVQDKHCELYLDAASGEVILTSLGTAEVHVNGRLLGPGGGQGGGAQVRLGHQDRLAFGRFHLFRFDASPGADSEAQAGPGMGWQKAQQELLSAPSPGSSDSSAGAAGGRSVAVSMSMSPGLSQALGGLTAVLEAAAPPVVPVPVPVQAPVAGAGEREKEAPPPPPPPLADRSPSLAVALESSFDSAPGSLNESLEAAMDFLDTIDWDEGVARLEEQDAAKEAQAQEPQKGRGRGQRQEAPGGALLSPPPPVAHVPEPPADEDDLDAYFEYITSPQPKPASATTTNAAPAVAVGPVGFEETAQQERVTKGSKLLDGANLRAGAGGTTSTTTTTTTSSAAPASSTPPPRAQSALLPPPQRSSFEDEANALKEDLLNMQAALEARMARYASAMAPLSPPPA